jgi:hypothetical protein
MQAVTKICWDEKQRKGGKTKRKARTLLGDTMVRSDFKDVIGCSTRNFEIKLFIGF